MIWDAGAEHTISAHTHHMRVDYSMFEGYQVKGNARTVISRGDVVIDKNSFTASRTGPVSASRARGGAWHGGTGNIRTTLPLRPVSL